MRIEFAPRPEGSTPGAGDSDEPVGAAVWRDGAPVIEADEQPVHEALQRVFRPVPVRTEDPSYRRFGTAGDTVLQPGTLEWFRAAAFERARSEGLQARLVPGVSSEAGWDPAAQYRSFEESVERFEGGTPAL